MSEAASVASCHQYDDVLVDDLLHQLAQELEGVNIVNVCLSLSLHAGCHAQNGQGTVEVLLMELLATIHAEISKSMQSW